MKGLIINDLLVIKKCSKQYLIFILFFILLSFASNIPLFLNSMFYMLSVTIILGQYMTDTATGWNIYCTGIPVLRKDYIKAKYYLLAGIMLCIFLISILLFPIIDMLEPTKFLSYIYANIDVFSYAVIMFSLSMPIMLKLNPQVAKFITGITAGLIAGGSMPFVIEAEYSDPKAIVAFLILPLSLLIFIISLKISQRIYDKKEI